MNSLSATFYLVLELADTRPQPLHFLAQPFGFAFIFLSSCLGTMGSVGIGFGIKFMP